QASGVGLKDSIGSPTATIQFEDLEKCDLFFLIGGNPASNHPRLMATLVKLRRRGGKVIVVNPARELGLANFRVPSNVKSLLFGDEIASMYLQPTIGGDIGLFAGIAKRLFELGAVERAFVDASTEGFAEFQSFVDTLTWADIEASSGLPRGEIEAAAEEYARANRAVFAWTMGITHHEHGTENVQWIVNLALLRGMIGKEGAGVMPIRGHSNVQGMGSVGVSPAMSKAAVEGLAALGYPVPEFKGYDTMAAMEAADRSDVSFGLCLGGNLYGANPDAAFASLALANVDTLVYLSTSLNTGHAHGLGKTTLILPVQARDEEAQGTTQESMFSYVRLSDGGPARFDGPRAETSILAEIASRVLTDGPLEWGSLGDHDAIRRLISRLAPHLKEIESIGETKKEFTIPGRVLHQPRFATPTGRAAFRAHPLPAREPLGKRQLRLMTIRSEGQFNTVVYDEEDIYRGQERRDVILMNRADIADFDLRVDHRVTVRSETGEMRNILVREFEIARGCAAMYYPEANVLVSRKTDSRSKTPAFKSVEVTLDPSQSRAIEETPEAKPALERNPTKAC
ncbi:MAG TPA: molybdopterin dinucleotide binding domain-containing protein, partial [Fimbriimonadaceae bacterium]|nr:molybdopterin dinucleotide binding domain-containing protein [Fimbriimonadaceae bacterium]